MRKIVLVLFLVWIGFVLGYLKYHNGAPRIEPHLVFAMRYISTFASENRKFPTTEEFKLWSGNNYANYGFEYYPDESNKAYVVGAWDGDAMQYFNSKTNKISYGKF